MPTKTKPRTKPSCVPSPTGAFVAGTAEFSNFCNPDRSQSSLVTGSQLVMLLDMDLDCTTAPAMKSRFTHLMAEKRSVGGQCVAKVPRPSPRHVGRAVPSTVSTAHVSVSLATARCCFAVMTFPRPQRCIGGGGVSSPPPPANHQGLVPTPPPPPPGLQGAQPKGSHCPPDGKCHFQWQL